MKRKWTRGEKLLWATPLLLIIAAGAALWGPDAARKQLGRPIVLETATGKELKEIALSRDGSMLAATGGHLGSTLVGSGKVQFWNARTLQPVAPWKLKGVSELDGGSSPAVANRALALSPDGKSVVLSRSENKPFTIETPLALFDIASGQPQWRHAGLNYVYNARFSPDGTIIGLTHRSNYIFLRASDGAFVSRWSSGNNFDDSPFAWYPDSNTVASVVAIADQSAQADEKMARELRYSYKVETRRVRDGRVIREWELGELDRVEGLDISPDGQSVSVITKTLQYGGTNLMLKDAKTGHTLWAFDASKQGKSATSGVRSARFSPRGDSVAAFYNTGKFDQPNFLLLLDAQTGNPTKTLTLNGNLMGWPTSENSNVLAWSPDSKRLYARGQDAVLVWDID